MVSSTDGSPTKTCWNRRSRAASFSMCLRYSSSVVAPTSRSSPRASIGLSMLPASIVPSPVAPAPTTVCSSSMKVMTSSLGPGDLLEDGLEPLLELAAVLRAGHHRAEVERDQRLAAQALGDVARDDALGEPLDDGGLADSGVTDEDGVVLGTPRQHLHDPADLGVAADDRVQPALAGGGGQVGAVLLQGLEGRLRLLGVDATPTAQLRDGRLDRGGVEAEVPGAREREQQVVGRDEGVAHRRHQRARALQHGERTAGQLRRGERRAGHRRQRREDPVGCGDGPGDGRPGGLEQRRGGRVGLLGQGLQDVRGLDVGMSVRGGRARGGRQGLVGLGRQLQIHGVRVPLSAGMRVCRFTEDNVGQS